MPSVHCAHCGALDCQSRYHACLALDFTDTGYGAVHHLVVAAYMLQHDVYESGVRAAMSDFVLEHLDRPPTADAMRRIRARTDGEARVRRRTPDDDPSGPSRMAPDARQPTVADIDTASAEAYRLTVRTGAEAVAKAVGRRG